MPTENLIPSSVIGNDMYKNVYAGDILPPITRFGHPIHILGVSRGISTEPHPTSAFSPQAGVRLEGYIEGRSQHVVTVVKTDSTSATVESDEGEVFDISLDGNSPDSPITSIRETTTTIDADGGVSIDATLIYQRTS